MMANTWQGEFRGRTCCSTSTAAPARSRPSRPGYGLYDMAGNVWEWTSDFFTPRHPDEAEHNCCAPRNPRVLAPDGSCEAGTSGRDHPAPGDQGRSHLCAPNYRHRYRPAARQGEAVDTSTGHIGFRCIIRVPAAG
ncbi:MAG: SUMF1/EgtB/PvdO family nonheme iron enzyme [Chloroflexota bacterium]